MSIDFGQLHEARDSNRVSAPPTGPHALIRLARPASWRVLLLTSCLSLVGCALVAHRDYFAVASDVDWKESSNPQGGDATLVYTSLKPDVAIFEREGVRFRLSVDESGESPILLGPLVPVVPIILLNPWTATRLRTDRLLLRLDVGGNVSADKPVQLHFDDVELRVVSLDKPRVPVRVFGLKEHGYRHVECEDRTLNLPSAVHYKHQDGYWFQLEYGPGFPRIESFEVNLGGVTVGGRDVEPMRLAFSRRGGWYWVLSGMQ